MDFNISWKMVLKNWKKKKKRKISFIRFSARLPRVRLGLLAAARFLPNARGHLLFSHAPRPALGRAQPPAQLACERRFSLLLTNEPAPSLVSPTSGPRVSGVFFPFTVTPDFFPSSPDPIRSPQSLPFLL
jgi:hypothetical protein